MTTEAVPEAHDFEVGDIVYGSWGYDQTNIDYYAIIRTTKTKVELLPIGTEIIACSHGSDTVVPDPTTPRSYDIMIQTGTDSPYGKPQRETKLCSTRRGWKDEWTVTLNGRHSAYRYDGPNRETSVGWGH